MKITPEDYATIKGYVEQAVALGTPEEYEDQYSDSNLSPKRLRWDLFRWAKKKALKDTGKHLIGDGAGAPGLTKVYSYAHDSHIDTALRRMMTEFGMHWAAQK